jgi:DNA-binding transcriptional LysR family regulator
MTEFSLLSLRVIREVAALGSFSAAADRLGYTQSSVSRQVALAERAAGWPLFARHGRGVSLTDAGRLLLRHANAVLAEVELARESLDDLRARPPGRLRLGAFSTALAALVPRAMALFTERHPRTRVWLREGTSSRQLPRVASGAIELAIVSGLHEPLAGVIRAPLLEDPLLLAAPRDHPLAGARSVAADALRGERWIVGSADPRSELLGAWNPSAWNPQVAYVAREWTAKLGLVAAGHGVTLVPGLAAPALPDRIALIRIDHPEAIRPTELAIHEAAAAQDGVRAFIEAVRDVTAELAAELRRRLAP